MQTGDKNRVLDAALIGEITERVLAALSRRNLNGARLRPCDAVVNTSRNIPVGSRGAFAGCESRSHCLPVSVSARHAHLCEEDIRILFGDNYMLSPSKKLMGGQYAAEEHVTLVGSNLRAIERVRVLGPPRKFTQVEISATDGRTLGILPPVNESGNLKGASAIIIAGPLGAVRPKSGCIIAKRHIHMTRDDAESFGVSDRQMTDVRLAGARGGLMENVLVRVDPSFTLEMHIDTDEANAFGVTERSCGTLEQWSNGPMEQWYTAKPERGESI